LTKNRKQVQTGDKSRSHDVCEALLGHNNIYCIFKMVMAYVWRAGGQWFSEEAKTPRENVKTI
jgi:hypothetical protein